MKARLLWAVLVVALVAAAAFSVALRPSSEGPLDPSSAAPAGSKALATVLAGYGVHVESSRDAGAARGRVVVSDPSAYTPAELARLGGDEHTLAALGTAAEAAGAAGAAQGITAPGCEWPGARAAGPADLPVGTARLRAPGTVSCYGGAVLVAPRWTWLATARLVRNDTVARPGLAALDVNAISANRTVDSVTWLLPGSTATAEAAPSAWALFPGGARRAFVWLAVLGLVLATWQGRRLGRVVHEPLPVAVRAAEAVEGHGRLYQRARASERAGAALRAATLARLTARLGVPRGADAQAVCRAVSDRTDRPAGSINETLFGPDPHDDASLVRLADDLARLESDVAGAPAAIPLPTRDEGDR